MSDFLIYARKSSESEDRQALSIDSQIRELTEYARTREFKVIDVLSESRSAKTPGRPVFGELMRRLAKHEGLSILCWKLDRLARNPVDGGALIWALDQGAINEITVPGKSFSNRGDDKFWMQLEFGMAKKYVDDLSDNVKRGNRAKLEQGWLPGLPPLGYLNDRDKRTIIADPERFPLIRKVWRSILAGGVPSQVYERATHEWGLRTRPIQRTSGGSLARSGFYRMLSNPFYCGLLVRNGESFAGAHPPMISREEFDRVQEILGRPNRPLKKHLFAFSGFIKCGECGAAVTAEEQVNRYGYRYQYYHCTKRKKGTRCAQRAIRVEQLESQIADTLGRIALPESHRDWALRRLSVLASEESAERQSRIAGLERAHHAAKRKSGELLELRLRGLLTDQEFLAKKGEVTTDEVRVREQLEHAKTAREPIWFEPTRNAIIFANQAPKRFATSSRVEKRAIVSALGSNLTLTNKILRIQAQSPFIVADGKGASYMWCTQRDARRTFLGWKSYFTDHPHRIQWPEFCREWWTRWRPGRSKWEKSTERPKTAASVAHVD